MLTKVILLQHKITILYLNIFKNVIYFPILSCHYSSLQSMSHDPSEIILIRRFETIETKLTNSNLSYIK